MKIVRDYLTSEELNYIINAMLEKETAFDREVVKVGLVAQLLAEDIGEFNDCNDVYDKVVADDTINFSKIVNNYDVIDKLIAEELGINKIAKDFTNIINTKLDSALTNIELNGAINQLKEMKEQENAKPIKGGKNGKTTK